VVERNPLTQHQEKGSFHWFWCAGSACTEKPKETIRRPLCFFGSKALRHGKRVGVTLLYQVKIVFLASMRRKRHKASLLSFLPKKLFSEPVSFFFWMV